MYCHKCGAKLQKNIRYCQECGEDSGNEVVRLVQNCCMSLFSSPRLVQYSIKAFAFACCSCTVMVCVIFLLKYFCLLAVSQLFQHSNYLLIEYAKIAFFAFFQKKFSKKAGFAYFRNQQTAKRVVCHFQFLPHHSHHFQTITMLIILLIKNFVPKVAHS